MTTHAEAVAAYLGHLAQSGASVSSVNVALAAIAAKRAERGRHLDRKHPAIANIRKGIERHYAKPARQARPLSLQDLKQVLAASSGDDLRSGRYRALILVAFGALRRSEIAALSLGGRSPVEITTNGVVIMLTGTKSRLATDAVALPRRTDALCPAAALESYLELRGTEPGPLLEPITKGGQSRKRPLDATGVRHILKSRFDQVFAVETRKGAVR